MVSFFCLRNFKILFALFIVFHIFVNILDVPSESFLSNTSLYGIILLGLGLLINNTKHKVLSWLSVSVSPQVIPLCRIIYGVLCLFSAIQHFTLIPYGLEPYNFVRWGMETPSFLAYFLSGLNILALLFLIVGYRVRLAWILIFLLGGIVLPFSLEIFVKNIFNFYAIFIPAHLWHGRNNKETEKYNGWPILMMCFSYAVLMTFAGLFKLLDPVWQEGLGLYYSLNIPFFMPRYLWWMLDSEFLMDVLNWVTLFFELLALPLVIFKKTRIYGLITLVGLGLFLTFVMQGIGVMGGPIVLVACLLGLSLTKYSSMLKIPSWNLSFFKIKEENTIFKSQTLGLFVFWITITGIYSSFFKQAGDKIIYYPPKYGNYTVNKLPLVKPEGALLERLRIVYKLLSFLRPPIEWEFVWTLELFDYHHLFDRIYFRVVFFDEKDKLHEPIVFFDNDGAISKKQPLLGNEKFILTAFRIMDGLRSDSFVNNGRMSKAMIKELKGIVKFCKSESSFSFVKAKIQIKQVSQPYEYKGDFKEWANNEWEDLYTYDFETKKENIEAALSVYDYSKHSIEEFREKIITPNF